MPCCAAWRCSTRPGMGKIMHRFPRNPQRRQLWAIKVKRKDWSPNNNSFLCSDHFDDYQYESEREDNLRKLKPNAVPTIFAYQRVPPKFRKPPKKRSSCSPDNSKVNSPTKRILQEHGYSSKNGKECKHDQDKPDDSPSKRGPLTETTVSDKNDEEGNQDMADDSRGTLTETTVSDKSDEEGNQDMPDDSPGEGGPLTETTVSDKSDEDGKEDKPDDSPDKRGALTETTALVLNMSLEQKVKRQATTIARLKKSIAKERRMKRKLYQEKMSLEGKLSKIFSPNQLLQLGRVKCRGVKWSDDVIKRARQLMLACGAGGYQLLLTQGQPLPSMRTLRRKMESV